MEKAGRLLVEGLGGAALRTGLYVGGSVSAHAGPIVKLAERWGRFLLTPMPCCYVIVVVI